MAEQTSKKLNDADFVELVRYARVHHKLDIPAGWTEEQLRGKIRQLLKATPNSNPEILIPTADEEVMAPGVMRRFSIEEQRQKNPFHRQEPRVRLMLAGEGTDEPEDVYLGHGSRSWLLKRGETCDVPLTLYRACVAPTGIRRPLPRTRAEDWLVPTRYKNELRFPHLLMGEPDQGKLEDYDRSREATKEEQAKALLALYPDRRDWLESIVAGTL